MIVRNAIAVLIVLLLGAVQQACAQYTLYDIYAVGFSDPAPALNQGHLQQAWDEAWDNYWDEVAYWEAMDWETMYINDFVSMEESGGQWMYVYAVIGIRWDPNEP